MPALKNKTYFNYGGQGPLPKLSLNAIQRSWLRIQELGPFTNDVWPYIAKEISSTRGILSDLCGVPSNRLALTENVTSGCVLPIWGLPISSGERILISDCEHPGVVAACKELARRKDLAIDFFSVQRIRYGLKEQEAKNEAIITSLEKGIKRKTRLVVLSHLLWNTGQVMPIPAVSKLLSNHPNKPFLLVDAAQSFGQLPVQEAASSSDIFAFTGHKWACGPEGLGGLAVSERIIEEANPTLIGWRSLKNEEIFNENLQDSFHLDSRRFEVATSCIPLLAGLRCSLELMEKEGSAKTRIKLIRKLSTQFWEKLQALEGVTPLLNGPPEAGLVSFVLDSNYSPKKVVKKLGEKNLWIRDLGMPSCLRACFHITTQEEEVIALIDALQNIIKGKS